MLAGIRDRLGWATVARGHRLRSWLSALLGALPTLALATGALAQCFPIAEGPRDPFGARLQLTALPAAGSVRLTYLGHSSFLIESPEGATAITDYNGYLRAPEPPAIVTMNNAHETHYTDFVEPGVQHILRGWDPAGGVAQHDQMHLDMRVRNVPTNVRSWAGTRVNGNSIFIFEVADLCIAHLGHLHHTLSDVHLGEIGMIDILMVPVDGSFTIAQELMQEVIDQIGAPLLIPMHYFSQQRLARFIDLVSDRYEAVYSDSATVTLSRLTLPYRKILVFPGG
jgi:L-ascorbate metabolism protein UlaG (beta-lactamase superfamily)